MVRTAGSNTPIDQPQLTDFTQSNFGTVIKNTQENYALASDALKAQAQVGTENYNYMVQKWKNAEEQKRMNAEAKGQGGGALQGIAEVGKQLVSGFLLMDEMKAKKAEQKRQAGLQEREMQLQENKFQYSKEADQQAQVAAGQKAEQDTFMAAIEAQTQEVLGNAYDIISKEGREKGIQAAEAQVQELYQSEHFKLLSPQNKVLTITNLNKSIKDLKKEKADELYEAGRKENESQLSLLTTNWQVSNTANLQTLAQGAGQLSPEEAGNVATELINNWDKMATSPQYSALMSDKRNMLKARIEVISQVGDSLEQYYKDDTSRQNAAYRFVEAAQQMNALQIAKDAGDIDDATYNLRAEESLRGLGIGMDARSFPTSVPKLLDNRIKDMEQISTYSELLAKNQNLEAVIGEQTPNGRTLKRANIGTYLYNAINEYGVEATVGELEGLISSAPQKAQRMNAQTIVPLLKDFQKDRTAISSYNQQILKLEQDVHAMGYTPKVKEYTLRPGEEVGGSGGETTMPEVILAPNPNAVPKHSPQEMEALKAQMQEVSNQRNILLHKWQQYGVDINQPQNRAYLDNLRASSQATQDIVNQKAKELGIDVEITPNDFVDKSKPKGDNVQNKVVNAVTYEIQKNKLLETRFPISASWASPQQKALVQGIWSNQVQQMVGVTANGGTPGDSATLIESINSQLKANKQPLLTEEQTKDITQGADSLVRDVRNKRNYYLNRFGERSSAPRPTNFSSGNSAPSPVTLPKNEGNLNPSYPLKGQLATMKGVGFAPFKGGNVRYSQPDSTGYLSRGGRHKGIDILSDDPRVATMQGGKVGYAGNWNGYGNVVMVKTPDGRTELYGHLKNINVKVGDAVTPGTQVGIMGSTGKSTGPHLHFEVWNQQNWADGTTNVPANRQVMDPTQYMKQLNVKVPVPKATGGDPVTYNGGQSSRVGYKTGGVRLSNGLLYYGGYVLEPGTGKMRKAGDQDKRMVATGTPVISYRSTFNNEVSQQIQQNGQVEATYYDPPAKARNLKTYMMLRPSGTKDKNGIDIWYLEAYAGGVKKFSKPVRTDQSMMPDGEYKVAGRTMATGSGNNTVPVSSATGMSGTLGIQFDVNGNGTSGGINLVNPNDMGVVSKYTKDFGGSTMFVVSQPTRVLRQSPPGTTYQNKPLNFKGDLSINKADYSSVGTPDSDFGYPQLAKNPRLRQALYTAAQKTGIPMVWMADQFIRESGLDPTVPSPSGQHRGLFQIDVAGWGKKLGFTQADFYKKDSVYWQIETLYPKYIAAIEQELGRKLQNFEEVLMAVWGGGRGVRNLDKYRANGGHSMGDGYVDWDGYTKKVGAGMGRNYKWKHKNGGNLQSSISHMHDIPSDNCPACASMLRGGDFVTHYG